MKKVFKRFFFRTFEINELLKYSSNSFRFISFFVWTHAFECTFTRMLIYR